MVVLVLFVISMIVIVMMVYNDADSDRGDKQQL